MFRTLSLAAVFGAALSLSTGAAAMPTTYSGATFPDGDISFADEVISFNPGPADGR